MQDQILPVGEWLPDQPQLNNPGVNTANNVLPLTKQSYTPASQFARSATAALPSAALGAFAAQDSSGNPGLYTGTTGDLYILTSASAPNFSKVSSASGAYAVPSGGYWDFDTFDANTYASNGVDPIQSAATANGAANFATVSTNAPKARIIKSIQPGFLLCGDIVDVTVGTQRQGIRWSSLGDPTSTGWPLIGSAGAIATQSDWQNVEGNNGQLRAIAPNLATCNAALFFDRSIFRMIYTGDAAIFNIQAVEKLSGTPAGRSVVQIGQIAYYLSHDGFRAFDGTMSLPIGFGKVNRFFFTDADPNFLAQVTGAADPATGLVYWVYAGQGSANGVPNRVLVYNTLIQRFSLITGAAIANIFVGLSIGVALDNITSQLGFTLDAIPYSLDSAILAGGNLTLGGFDNNNFFGFFTGTNMPFQVETSEKQLILGRKARLNACRPLAEGDTVLAAVASRESLSAPVVYSTAAAPNVRGIVPTRADGRYHRAMISALAGNMVSHVEGAELSYSPAGR